MAAFWCRRIELLETLGEFVGYKAGLVLSSDEIRAHLPEVNELIGPDEAVVRLRYEELDSMARQLLYALGAAHGTGVLDPLMELQQMYRRRKAKRQIVQVIQEEFLECGRRMAARPGEPMDISPIFVRVAEEFGVPGLNVYEKFVALLHEHIHGSIFSQFRRIEWSNIEELANLFQDESLAPAHGVYLDQRFIDYLERNDSALDAMQWRKFEGLAGEYFAREGYRVDMGSGRADGGVDLRVWRDPKAGDIAPTILVQCKRQKAKVPQVIVKALYADVLNEKAESGLIVTTSTLEPGAETVRVARGYPIRAADRSTLRTWLEDLRTPLSPSRRSKKRRRPLE